VATSRKTHCLTDSMCHIGWDVPLPSQNITHGMSWEGGGGCLNPLEEMKKLLCSRRLHESAVGKCNPSAQSVSLLVNYVSALGHEPLPGANPAQAPMMEFVQFGRTRATTLGHIVLDQYCWWSRRWCNPEHIQYLILTLMYVAKCAAPFSLMKNGRLVVPTFPSILPKTCCLDRPGWLGMYHQFQFQFQFQFHCHLPK
jgi:hypothetical protein